MLLPFYREDHLQAPGAKLYRPLQRRSPYVYSPERFVLHTFRISWFLSSMCHGYRDLIAWWAVTCVRCWRIFCCSLWVLEIRPKWKDRCLCQNTVVFDFFMLDHNSQRSWTSWWDSQDNTLFKFVAIKRPRRSCNTQHRFLAIRKHMVRGWWRWDNLRVCLQGGRLLLYSPNSKCFDRRGLSSSTKAGLSQLWSIRRDEQATNRALTPRDTICYSKETQQWNAISCTKFKF